MPWTITFYSTRVERETLALPPGILASFLRITELIEEFGPDLGRPHTAPQDKGFSRSGPKDVKESQDRCFAR